MTGLSTLFKAVFLILFRIRPGSKIAFWSVFDIPAKKGVTVEYSFSLNKFKQLLK